MSYWFSENLLGFSAYSIPILIFLGRISDVSMGTLRIILVGRGRRLPATMLGFCEIIIWLLAISQIMQNLTNVANYIAYAAGFAAGTYVGMTIERRLAIGSILVRIIVPRDSEDLIMYLIARGFEVTRLNAEGALTEVTVILTVIKNKTLPRLQEILKKFHPKAFYTIEDIRTTSDPIHSVSGSSFRHRMLQPFYWFRKSK